MWKSMFILWLLSQLVGNINGGEFVTSESGNIYYVEKNLEVDWYEAIRICLTKNMSLICPDTLEKNVEINKLITKLGVREHVWTAGQEVNNYTYVWISTGNKVSWTHWRSSEPMRENSEKTQCIGFYLDAWASYTCTRPTNFICEENSFLKNIKINDNCTCHNENEKGVTNRSKLQSHNCDAFREKTEELKNLQKEYEQMQNQLILTTKDFEWKSQETEMVTKFHQREIQLVEERQKSAQKEIQLLEEKLSLISNCSHNPGKTYNISISMNGHLN